MVYYRGTAICDYDIYRISDNSKREHISFKQSIESDEYSICKELRDAINDKETFGDDMAKFVSVQSAADAVGEPLPDDPLDVDKVTGVSLEARNITGEGKDMEIVPKVPKLILAEIEYLETQKLGVSETEKVSIQKGIDHLKEMYCI